MDLQTRKLNLISYLAQIQDESFFDKIEKFVLKKKSATPDSDFNPFTVEELISRIEQSERDIEKGLFKSQDELDKISSGW